jgi:xanthine dehydrogenase molybdopterin-binding subunit B
VLGTRPTRHDALEKVTGAARYGADVHLPGMLHGKILRSPHAHARIHAIDTSKAAALPGVRAVATAQDFPIVEDRLIDFAELQGNARMIAANVLAGDVATRSRGATEEHLVGAALVNQIRQAVAVHVRQVSPIRGEVKIPRGTSSRIDGHRSSPLDGPMAALLLRTAIDGDRVHAATGFRL